MAAFKNQAEELKRDLKEMLREHDNQPKYPGKSALDDGIKALSHFESITDEASFFKTISVQKDDLLDLAEDIAPVRTFYDSDTQKKIFDDYGLRALRFYDSSKEHITDAALTKIVDEIRSIVNNRAPYEMLKRLPELYQKFIESYNTVLDQKLVPVKQVIEQDMKIVLDALEGQEYKSKYESPVRTDFQGLLERAANEPNISDMLGFKDKADSLCKNYLDRFAAVPAPAATPVVYPNQPSDSSKAAEPRTAYGQRKVKNIMARNIVVDTWYIKDRTDIDKYLDSLRKQIEAELANYDEVRLHL